jgi:hypothetical protein
VSARSAHVTRERAREAVLDALRMGASNGSSGREIHDLRLDDNCVERRCSPARSVALRSGRWQGCKVNAHPTRHELAQAS